MHITDLGFILLANGSLPIKFWTKVFITATHIISVFPYEMLSKSKPNYDQFKLC